MAYTFKPREGLTASSVEVHRAFDTLRQCSGIDYRLQEIRRRPGLLRARAPHYRLLKLGQSGKYWLVISEWLLASSMAEYLSVITASYHDGRKKKELVNPQMVTPRQVGLYAFEENQYLAILKKLRDQLVSQGATANRTAMPAAKIFAATMRFNLAGGTIPLLTTKKLHLKSIVHELIWFLSGDTNNETLANAGVHIWDEWAIMEDIKDRKKQPLPKGSLGPLYGEQWRRFPAGEFFYNLTDDELKSYIANMACEDYEALRTVYEESDMQGHFHVDLVAARAWLTKRGIDQISQMLFLLKHRPNSRRIIVTAWNPQVVPSDELSPQENVIRRRAALAACHAMFQFTTQPLTFDERVAYIRSCCPGLKDGDITPRDIDNYRRPDGRPFPAHRLNCSLTQRSADVYLGVPYNVASYAILTHMVAKQVNMLPGELAWLGVDTHLYANHQEATELQLSREPRPFPTISLDEVPNLFDYRPEHIHLNGYDPHPVIKAAVAV